MTAWTAISNAAVAVGGIPSSTTVTALRDNPAALAEQVTGAPVIFSGWHPYNKVSVGDGVTGLIYDGAVNGVQASIVTPDFEDGYEYRVLALNMSHNSGSNQTLELELANSGGSYVETISTATARASGSTGFYFDAQFSMPRLAWDQHPVLFLGDGIINPNIEADMGGSKILRARVSFSAGSIDGGKIYFLRRREYISSP